MDVKIGFVGAGNMAGAIIGGAVEKGGYAPEEIGVYDISPEKREEYAARGCRAFANVEELVAACGTIVLAVKPQVFPAVLPQVKTAMTADKVLVSIAAGITAQSIQEAVGFPCKLVMVMPNTPLLVGEGAAALSRVAPTTPAEFQEVRALFAAAGIAEEIGPDKMREIIPVNGSSPAFLYLFAKVIVECAQREGIDPDTANRLICQTLVGAAKMMTDTGKTHQELIDMVCSPGGTTLAALEAMETAGFSDAVRAGFDACVKRAKELSQ